MTSEVSLKEKLKSRSLTLGAWQTLAHPAITEIYCRSGFDWVVIDLEHSVITIREAEEIIRVAQLSNVPALVRLSDHSSSQIARVLDAGATGIIAPRVNNREEAESIVSAALYPPRGNRGTGLARATGYGSSFHRYRARALEETIVIVMIEHVDAIKNMSSILSVEGVDGFLVGPYDLSASLGIAGQFDQPRFQDAMKSIMEVGKKSGKPAGLHVVEPDVALTQQKIEEGYRFVAHSLDIRILDHYCRTALQDIRGSEWAKK